MIKRTNYKWTVSGWVNGIDFDNNKAPNHQVSVLAKTEEEADEKGDKLLQKHYNTCDVVTSSRYHAPLEPGKNDEKQVRGM